ncbi:MAG: glycosyltransferase family 4 protein [Bacteroidia bacterium]
MSISDVGWGGASIAAYRIHKALRKVGLDSLMLVQDKRTDDYTVLSVDNGSQLWQELNRYRSYIDKIPLRLFYPRRRPESFTPAVLGWSQVVKRIREIAPSVVHLHWIGGGMLPIEDLEKIPYPMVWTMHDMWPFTGGCHYALECTDYERSCGRCPILQSGKHHDLSAKVWKRKRKVYEALEERITFVVPSRWLEGCARKSALLQHKRIFHVPYPIDTDFFRPIEKSWARQIANLGEKKHLIGFGALKAIQDRRKGFEFLIQALERVRVPGLEAVVFGSSEPPEPPALEIPCHYMGHLYDTFSLVLIYNALEVFIMPSVVENLPNTVLEGLACGVPVVAFATGGTLDLIDHMVNGYLARPYEVEDLAEGIRWALENAPNLRIAARQKALRYSEAQIAARYIEIYQSLVS